MTDRPAEHRVREEAAGPSSPWRLRVTSYRLGTEWIATVDNIDPGATLARAAGTTREAAEAEALAKARHMVGKTRTFTEPPPVSVRVPGVRAAGLVALVALVLATACAARPAAGERNYLLTAAIDGAPPGATRAALEVWLRRPGDPVRLDRLERRFRFQAGGRSRDVPFRFTAPASPARFDMRLEVAFADGRYLLVPIDPGEAFARGPAHRLIVRPPG